MKQPIVQKEAALFLEAVIGFLITKITANLYAEVAKKVKRLAVRYLNNQFVLNYIASHDKDPQLRLAAVSKLISPVLLRKLLAKESKDDVRIAILTKLRAADTIKEYHRSNLRSPYKLRLIHLVRTQAELYEFLRGETDKELIKTLLSMITSPRMIERVQLLPQPEIRKWVEARSWQRKRKEESSTLLESALKSTNLDPSLVRQISNPRTWYQIALRHKNQAVQSEAIARLEGKEALLTRLEENKNLNLDLRLQAATMLGTNLVPQIAKTDPNPAMRLKAVALLDPEKNADTISSVLNSEKKSDVLTQAVLITTSLSDLESLKSRVDPKVSPNLLKILEERIDLLTTTEAVN